MVKGGSAKRKARAKRRGGGDPQSDDVDFEFSLSDLENDRTPVQIDYTVDQLSKDGRGRVSVDKGTVQIVKDKPACDPLPTASAADCFFHDLADINIDAVRTEGKKGPRDESCRKRRYISSVSLQFPRCRNCTDAHAADDAKDRPLTQWMPYRDEYLDEMVRLEGRGEYGNSVCSTCKSDVESAPPEYRCRDCFHPELQCRDCILVSHARAPFDRIEVSYCLFSAKHATIS